MSIQGSYKSIATGQLVKEEGMETDTAFYWGCDMGATLYFGKVIGVNTMNIVDSNVDNMGFSISITTLLQYLYTLGLL